MKWNSQSLTLQFSKTSFIWLKISKICLLSTCISLPAKNGTSRSTHLLPVTFHGGHTGRRMDGGWTHCISIITFNSVWTVLKEISNTNNNKVMSSRCIYAFFRFLVHLYLPVFYRFEFKCHINQWHNYSGRLAFRWVTQWSIITIV